MFKLGKSWKRYENEVINLLDFYSHLDENQLSFHSDRSEWNLFQVFEHLYQVEYLTFQAIKERVDSGIKKKSTFKHQKRYFQLAFALILPSKYRVPKAVVIADKPKVTSDLVNQWQSQNIQLKAYLEALPQNDKYMLLFKHPIAGPLNIMQTLGFLYYHLKHHHKQINSIKSDAMFPGKK